MSTSSNTEKEAKKETTSHDPLTMTSLTMFALDNATIDEKLEDYKGLCNAVDDKVTRQNGKLLEDYDNSAANATGETYTKILDLVGGKIPVMIFLLYALF